MKHYKGTIENWAEAGKYTTKNEIQMVIKEVIKVTALMGALTILTFVFN